MGTRRRLDMRSEPKQTGSLVPDASDASVWTRTRRGTRTIASTRESGEDKDGRGQITLHLLPRRPSGSMADQPVLPNDRARLSVVLWALESSIHRHLSCRCQCSSRLWTCKS